MTEPKRANIRSQIKKQIGGQGYKTESIDTEKESVLEYIAQDIIVNPHLYTRVKIMGVDVIVKLKDLEE